MYKKSLILAVFLTFFVALSVYAQNNTGFALFASEDVTGVSASVVANDGNPAPCYSFQQTRVSGPTTGYAKWKKVYTPYSISKVLMDQRGAINPGTNVQVAIQMRGSSGVATSTFNNVPYNNVSFLTYEYPLNIPGTYDTLLISCSFLPNEWGSRDLRTDNIRFVLTNGDTVLVDPGTGGGIQIPPAPILVSPANNSTATLPVMLDWNPSYQATSYNYQVIWNSQVVVDQTTSNTSVSISSPLMVGNTYQWRVRASNSVGTSDWSTTWVFTVGPAIPPVPPGPYNPPNHATGLNPQNVMLGWGSSGNGVTYHVQVATNSSFGGQYIIFENMSLSTTWVQLPPLQPSTTYYWHVRASFPNGGWSNWTITFDFLTSAMTGLEQNGNDIPKVYALGQNYPNPFNPTTKIDFDLPKSEMTSIKVYDILGREVAVLNSENLPAGSYTIAFNGSELSSGMYFYRITSGDFVATKKMTLVK